MIFARYCKYFSLWESVPSMMVNKTYFSLTLVHDTMISSQSDHICFLFKKTRMAWNKSERKWNILAHIGTMCPECFEELLHGHFFWYQMYQRAGCVLPLLKCWLSTELPSKATVPSIAWSVWLCPLFFIQTVSLAAACMHTSRGQSCHFRGHRQISANSGWCGSAPYNHPDVSNQLDFYYPPLPLFILSVKCHYTQETF